MENDTQRKIKFYPLPSSNAQYSRCRRAAMENVKKRFFEKAPYTALTVSNVYKIENELLLDKFQAQVQEIKGGKIKGLFCIVPQESLEHMVAFGMHSAEKMQANGSSIFQKGWHSFPLPGRDADKSTTEFGKGKAAAEASSPVPVRTLLDLSYELEVTEGVVSTTLLSV